MASLALAGSIEALHTHLRQSGVLATDKEARYLVYRLRRDLAIDLEHDEATTAWREQIALMDSDEDMEARR